MALAILKYLGINDGGHRFAFDIGKNRYYAWSVGDHEIMNANGLKILQNRTHTSPLIGSLKKSSLGRGTFEAPASLFDRKNRFVQLVSFRTADKTGPAISDIVQVHGSFSGVGDLPKIAFARSLMMDTPIVENVPMHYREARPFSQAMFLSTLASLLPIALPAITSIIGMFRGSGNNGKSGSNGKTSGGNTAPPLLQSISDPATIKMIVDLVQRLSGTNPAQTQEAKNGKAVAKALAETQNPQKANSAPELLAMLPTLMPLLQKSNMLTPETLKSLLQFNNPGNLIGTITNAILDIGKLGMASHEQDLQHLRALNPGVEDPALDKLLASLSLSLSQPGPEIKYRRTQAVTLHFEEATPVLLHGRSRVAYGYAADLAFPISVETPKTIQSSVIQLLIKKPDTLEILAEKKYRAQNLSTGRIEPAPRIPRDELSALQPNEEYLVCISLVWKNRRGDKVGTSRTQLITLLGEYAFDHLEESEETIPLNDVSQFREFWQKTWEGRFSQEKKRVKLDCKYYYALEGDRASNARMETKTKFEENGLHEASGMLKSGMVLSPYALNHLLNRISSYPALGEAELSALKSPDFIKRSNQAARVNVKLKGRASERASLWVYPEVKLQRIILKRVSNVDPNGRVGALADHEVHFPMPVSIHFIGARSQR